MAFWRLAGDVHLRGEAADAGGMHLEVDVRGAARVGDGADGAEGVAAVGIDRDAAVALEARVVALVAGVAGVIVDAARVALPDLDHGAADDLSPPVEDAPRDMGNLPYGLRRPALHAHEVGIHVGGEGQGIEGAFRLARRDDQG